MKEILDQLLTTAKKAFPDYDPSLILSPKGAVTTKGLQHALVANSLSQEDFALILIELLKTMGTDKLEIDVKCFEGKKKPIKNIYRTDDGKLTEDEFSEWQDKVTSFIDYGKEVFTNANFIVIIDAQKNTRSGMVSSHGTLEKTAEVLMGAMRQVFKQGIKEEISKESIVSQFKDIIKNHDPKK